MNKLGWTRHWLGSLQRIIANYWGVPVDTVHIHVYLFRNPKAFGQAKEASWNKIERGKLEWYESATEMDRLSIVVYKPISDIK